MLNSWLRYWLSWVNFSLIYKRKWTVGDFLLHNYFTKIKSKIPEIVQKNHYNYDILINTNKGVHLNIFFSLKFIAEWCLLTLTFGAIPNLMSLTCEHSSTCPSWGENSKLWDHLLLIKWNLLFLCMHVNISKVAHIIVFV